MVSVITAVLTICADFGKFVNFYSKTYCYFCLIFEFWCKKLEIYKYFHILVIVVLKIIKEL